MKKITKFLDSVMGGIKRTCIAKALAVFAVASIAINANAQSGVNPVVDIEGLDGLTGKTFDELYTNAKTSNPSTFPTDKTEVYFLYNVKSGKFLTAGGYWGTHAAIAGYGKPMCFVKVVKSAGSFWSPTTYYEDRLYFRFDMKTGTTSGQGEFLGWGKSLAEANADKKDQGVFLDRQQNGSEWFFDKVTGTTDVYKLYTHAQGASNKVNYYLCSYKDQVYADRSCEAYTADQIKANGLDGYDEWRFFTYDQIYELQKNNADKMNKSLELSFKLKAPGFERGNKEITAWKTYSFMTNESSQWRFGLEHLYNKTIKVVENDEYDVRSFDTKGFTYTFDGQLYENNDDYRRNVAKYMCASATQVAGMIYQDVEVTLPGTYVIECKGYSTTKKAALFAGVVNPGSNTMYNKHLYKTELNQVSGMTAEEKTALHIDDKNMDYAGKAFLGSNKYINQVIVIVPQEAIVGGKATIRLGVMIGDYGNTKAPTADEWTVFDDFRLQYASKTTDSDLILDELRDELGYLVNSSDLFQNKTLHLNKKFVLNKWNTFVLPVNLTRDQVWSAFGGTTRLAKLSNLTETAIEFESVDLTKLTDEAPAIEAYQPYIIFPGKDADKTPVYTGQVTVGNTLETVTIAADHYVIPKVSLKLTANGNNKDFSKMDKDKWATKMSVKSTDGKMEAWGTFARTFGPSAKQNPNDGTWNLDKITDKGTIIGDRDDLIGSYFFDKGNMYHSATRPRGLRGFSCWFKPVNSTAPSQDVNYTLDGVTQSGTTGIEDILADYEQPVSRFANGIYNLNGQLVKQGNSTAGLPNGLYIVNGKKCIVR